MRSSKSLLFFSFILFSFIVSAQNKDVNKALDAKKVFIQKDDGLSKFFNESYGYAIFPNVGKGGMGVGGAHGNGTVFKANEATGKTSLNQVSVGFQFGGQSYMEVLFFEDQRAYDNFVEGKLKLSAQASAVAVTAGASANVGYNDGVAVFTIAKGGLMYEATVAGQKFSYEDF